MARPEHEKAMDIRRRELAFAHWRAEIVRGAMDPRTLEQELRRALNDDHVRSDPALTAQIREFARQRELELTRNRGDHDAEWTVGHQPGPVQWRQSKLSHQATPEEVRIAADRLIRQFDEYATHFFVPEARNIFERLQELAARHPTEECRQALAHCTETMTHLARRREDYAAHVEDLIQRGVQSAESGDHASTADVMRRLSSIHAAHPQLLSDERFAEIRDGMSRAGQLAEHRTAVAALVEKERAVAQELKRLAAVVHRFHRMARTAPHDGPDYRAAEAEYHRAFAAVQSHDKEWLSGLILELLDILGEWSHPPPKVEAQLDKFVASVRSSLTHLRREIKEIESEQRKDPA